MPERPEIRLTLGCCVVLVAGSACHVALCRLVWEVVVEQKQLDIETTWSATILGVISAPLVIPVAGFAVLTLGAMATRGVRYLLPGRSEPSNP